MLSLLRVQPDAGSIEVGHIHLSPALQQTRASTEAQFLIMSYVFDDLGYRRHEWKGDALNAPSRRAAERLGFSYEGIFRQAVVIKGRNRDTAWYAIVAPTGQRCGRPSRRGSRRTTSTPEGASGPAFGPLDDEHCRCTATTSIVVGVESMGSAAVHSSRPGA